MARRKYTEEMVDFVMKLSPTHKNAEIAHLFNKKFKGVEEVTPRLISGIKSRNNLRDMSEGPVYIQFVADNKDKYTNKEMIEMIKSDFDIEVTLSMLKHHKSRHGIKNKNDGTFKKGNVPWHKGTKGLATGSHTTFRKGHKSDAVKSPIGTERTRNGIVYIKVTDDMYDKRMNSGNWRPKHRWLWEKEYGPLKGDKVLVFKDRDKKNVVLDNLMCISRAEAVVFYKEGLYSDSPEANELGLEVSKLIILKNKLKRGEVTNEENEVS